MLMSVTCELSSFANTLDLELNGTDLLESRQNFCIKFVQKQNTNKQLCWTNVATECDVACLGSNTNTVINKCKEDPRSYYRNLCSCEKKA